MSDNQNMKQGNVKFNEKKEDLNIDSNLIFNNIGVDKTMSEKGAF